MRAQVQLIGFMVVFVALISVSVCPRAAMAASDESKLIVKGTDQTSDSFVATNIGRIGVGTGYPQGGIHIYGSTFPEAAMMVEGTESSGGGGFLGYASRSTGTHFPRVNDRLGYFLFGTRISATGYHAGGMTVNAGGDWTETSTPVYFSFLTTDVNRVGNANRFERLRITARGNTEVYGGLRLNKNSGSPTQQTCSAETRGTIWYTQGGASAKDEVEICTKDQYGNYGWRLIW